MIKKEGEIRVQPNGIKAITLSLPVKDGEGEWFYVLEDVPVCYGKADTHIREFININNSGAVSMYKHALECSPCKFRESCHSISKIDQLDSIKRILKEDNGINRFSK